MNYPAASSGVSKSQRIGKYQAQQAAGNMTPQRFKKLLTTDPTPLTGEEVEASIRELPRDPEIVGLYKKMADLGPLPPR